MLPSPDGQVSLFNMGELTKLIQQYLDKHQVRWAAFARNIGTAPQTVNKWKTKPETFPSPELLEGVARVTGVPYALVLDAVLVDSGYRASLTDDLETLQVRIARAAREANIVFSLMQFLESPEMPDLDDLDQGALDLQAGMVPSQIDEAIARFTDALDRAAGYGHEPLVDIELVRERLVERVNELDEAAQQEEAEEWHRDQMMEYLHRHGTKNSPDNAQVRPTASDDLNAAFGDDLPKLDGDGPEKDGKQIR